MRILLTGASGLIGSAVAGHFESGGHEVIPLSRKKGGKAYWNIEEGIVDLSQAGELDAVIHLAGESIAEGRWNKAKKQRIRDSRVQGTELLCEALAGLPKLPKVLLSGSAVGFYGDRGEEETLSEESSPGDGFLATVVKEWEAATEAASDVGIRVVHLRTGVVLSADGGALSKMLLPFKLGLGGVVGSGKQMMSWIDWRDEVAAIAHLIENEQVEGAVNLTAPQPLSNYDFTKTLGKVLRRPTIFPMPAFICRLLFGEMGEALLLGGSKVLPNKLLSSGFEFQYPDLESSLRAIV